MPHIIQDLDRTYISIGSLKEDLADGDLPGTVLVEHAPWTGREALPASRIPALAEALSTPTARHAARLRSWRIPWRSGLMMMGLMMTALLETPSRDDFFAYGVRSMLSDGPPRDLWLLLLFSAPALIPVLLAARLTSLGPVMLASAVGGSTASILTVLCEMFHFPALYLGAVFAAGIAAASTIERIRPTFPLMKRGWGRWALWGLLVWTGMLLFLLAETRPPLFVAMLGVGGLSVLLGWRLSDRAWWVLPGLLMLPAAEGIAWVGSVAPQHLILSWETQDIPVAGVELRIPSWPHHGSFRRLGAPLEATWRPWGDTSPQLVVTVRPRSEDTAVSEDAALTRTHHSAHFVTTLTCTPDVPWEEPLCAHILAEARLTDPFSPSATWPEATGVSDREADHLLALFVAGQHREGWAFAREHYPRKGSHYRSKEQQKQLWEVAVSHGGCEALTSQAAVTETATRIGLLWTCEDAAAAPLTEG